MNDDVDSPDYLAKRVDYLEEVNRQFRYAIDVVKAFGELQKRIGTEHDIALIMKESSVLISNLIHFESCAFFITGEDLLEFQPSYVEPAFARQALQEEVDAQIEAGFFSWALNLSRAEFVEPLRLPPGGKLLFHSLATKGRVLGMFVAVPNAEQKEILPETLVLLSLVVTSTALAMENAMLYRDIQRHNVNLNKTVDARTAEIRKFLGMAAHDLRNPLSAICGYSELLRDEVSGPLNPEQKDLVGCVFEASDVMLSLVNDLLDISVIESGEIRLDIQSVNLSELIGDVVRLSNMTAQRKKIVVRFLDDGSPLVVPADSRKIRQVMDNLISNAVKFSPPSTTVEVRAERVDGRVRVVVGDQGPGIPENEQMNLFKTFGRTSVRPTGGESSTGLGLAICKRIVTAHGGAIGVECPPGGGSRFSVMLDAQP